MSDFGFVIFRANKLTNLTPFRTYVKFSIRGAAWVSDYRYRREATANANIWRCVKKDCKARLTINKDDALVIGEKNTHNHDPESEEDILRLELKTKSRKRALVEKNEPPSKVIIKEDAIHKLSRAEQVTIFRLRTGHNRPKHHLFSRFRIRDGPNCPCGANRQDAQYMLQDCPLLDDARLKYWPEPREMNQKLYGSALQLGITAEFIYASDLTIWSTMKNEEEDEEEWVS
ncbi:hypothetical protein ElyMa_006557500 [Elysia marginata]|uniref:FLYWCH-type domain-containing protein n=1 Tax=Elysia marginata TaxID=1093978 RepID=A0AAV4I9C9_9GAST|nr:hypothetical protein ElyMa_006557500 [Elysia marginata]